MSLFAFRDSVSGKFLYFNGVILGTNDFEYTMRELNYAPYHIGYICLSTRPEIDLDENDSYIKEIPNKDTLEKVKIKIRRTEYGKVIEYSDILPPLPESKFASELYEVI
jgi:hypothetical protein